MRGLKRPEHDVSLASDALGPILGRAHVDRQHTEAARTATGATAPAKATATTANKKRCS